MAAGQAVSAIAGFQAASAQTAAKNKQIAANYNQRKASYEKGNLDRLAIYHTKVIDTEINQDTIGLAAVRAISDNTLAEAEADRQLEAKLQQIKIAKLKGTGVANEGGRSRSFGRNQMLAAGRSEGAIADQRERLSVATFIKNRKALEEANQARVSQWRSVNMGPGEAGPAPAMPKFAKGPSKLGLALNLAGAALTAAAPAFKAKPGLSGSTNPINPSVPNINQNAIVTPQGIGLPMLNPTVG
tara:strand:- start:2527 stop:3255 length:729 start_codon:yes stop_codon:yes gene_type:complete